MKKRILLAITLLVVMVTIISASGCAKKAPPAVSTTPVLTANEQRFRTIEANALTQLEKLNTLQTSLSQIQTDIIGLKTTPTSNPVLDTLKAKVDLLTADNARIQTSIVSLTSGQGSTAQITAQLAEINAKLTTINTDIATLKTGLTTNEAAIKALQTTTPTTTPGSPTGVYATLTGNPFNNNVAQPLQFNAIPASGYYVSSITITNPGTGYLTAPLVTIAGGATAQATISGSGGGVTVIQVISSGSGYTSAPIITISAPPAGGTTATATAVVTAAVNTVSQSFSFTLTNNTTKNANNIQLTLGLFFTDASSNPLTNGIASLTSTATSGMSIVWVAQSTGVPYQLGFSNSNSGLFGSLYLAAGTTTNFTVTVTLTNTSTTLAQPVNNLGVAASFLVYPRVAVNGFTPSSVAN